MIIAVNTRILPDDFPEEYGDFVYETFKHIAGNNPGHQFIFIFDDKYDPRFVFGPHVKLVVTGSATSHPLLWKWWYDVKIPAALKKYKADVFVSCDGICSLTTKVPQCLVVHNHWFLHYPSVYKKSHLLFYKRYMPKFLSKAKSIVTISGFSKQGIIKQYKTESAAIDVVYSGVKEIFKPIDDEKKAVTKNKYSEGREYFLYAGAINPQKNLMNLLKAFSVFKKRQQTNIKLVLAGRLAKKYGSFKEDLKSYKYRNDVVLTGAVEETELVQLIGAAYGFVYPCLYEGFATPVLEAMKCEVPVIAAINSSAQEIAKEAALYADVNSHTGIADKMMLLYKDENKRKELIAKGREIAKQYSWEKTADLLWQGILKACI